MAVDSYGCPVNASPTPPADDDNDGVPNTSDSCANTPQGATVDSSGCPKDGDRDGVYDGLDQCPNQGNAGYGVDSVGCPNPAPAPAPVPIVDSDGDGFSDGVDACPTQGDAGYGVDSRGCPKPAPVVDSDGDGYSDGVDACPTQGDAGYGVDSRGCPKPAPSCYSDADCDGVRDRYDNCANTPSGTEVDSRGCPLNPTPTPEPTPAPSGDGGNSGLSMVDDNNPDPEVCKSCHYDWVRFPQLALPGGPGSTLGSLHHTPTNPLYADQNCLGCHSYYIDAVTGAPDIVTGNTEGCATCHGAGGDYQAVGSPQSPNLHHFSETFKNGSCHTCHVLPETQLTSSEVCADCHGGQVASKNIIASFQQPYAHPLDALGRAGGNGDQVSCLDCHNPNKVTSDNRLRGVEGVEPVWPGNWEPITDYNAVASVEKQYQLCFKCHSSFKFGDQPPYDAFGKMMTDIAKEFNPNNASHHAVVAPGKNDFKMGTTDYSSALIGGYTPNSVLECDDCHRDSAQPDVEGPHGSAVSPLLQKPFTANTGKGSSNDLCFKCHDPNVYGVYGEGGRGKTGYSGGGEGNLHAYHVGDKGAKCQTCHAAVPHGWKKKHLLIQAVGSGADPAPYNGQAGSSRASGLNVRINVDSIESGRWSENVCHGPGTGSCDD